MPVVEVAGVVAQQLGLSNHLMLLRDRRIVRTGFQLRRPRTQVRVRLPRQLKSLPAVRSLLVQLGRRLVRLLLLRTVLMSTAS
jgi:hypothetical protein